MQANQQPNNQPPAASQAMTKQADKQGSISRQTSKPPTKQEPTSRQPRASQPAKQAKQAKFPIGTRAETVEYLEQEHYREDVEEEGLEAEARGVVFLDEDFGGVLREDGGELVLFR